VGRRFLLTDISPNETEIRMKSQAKTLKVAGKVRKATVLFAQSLLDTGVKVRLAYRAHRADSLDLVQVRGNGRFRADLVFNYEDCYVRIVVKSPRGIQMTTIAHTLVELRNVFQVWGIATIS
jgi:hypothetical protein